MNSSGFQAAGKWRFFQQRDEGLFPHWSACCDSIGDVPLSGLCLRHLTSPHPRVESGLCIVEDRGDCAAIYLCLGTETIVMVTERLVWGIYLFLPPPPPPPHHHPATHHHPSPNHVPHLPFPPPQTTPQFQIIFIYVLRRVLSKSFMVKPFETNKGCFMLQIYYQTKFIASDLKIKYLKKSKMHRK